MAHYGKIKKSILVQELTQEVELCIKPTRTKRWPFLDENLSEGLKQCDN